MPAPSTARDLRRTNRSAILRELLFAGESTRQALAGRTGLSAATVGLVIADLLVEGFVNEVGTQESSGGRPRTIVRMAPERGVTIGVDIGERGVRVEAFDLAWQRRAEVFIKAGPGVPDPVSMVGSIAGAVETVLGAAHIGSAALLGVGISVPGIVERGNDSVVHAVGFGWENVPLGRLLRAAIDAPVVVDNGAKTMGQAEMWFGAGRGASDAVVTLLGIGVGAAVFTDGRLYRGSQSSAGEWGHTPIVVGGERCRCGSRGCLEAYVGELTLLRQWAALDSAAPAALGPDMNRLDALFSGSEEDASARRVVEEMAEHLGAGLATLINLFNPQRIVLAGSVGLRLTPPLVDMIRSRAGRYALRQPFESVEIVRGQLGDDAVALGAATLVVDGLLTSGFAIPSPAGDTAPMLAGHTR